MRICAMVFILISLTFGCRNPEGEVKNSEKTKGELENKSAELFSITDEEGYRVLSIYSKKNEHVERYFLVSGTETVPDIIKHETVIRTPCRRVVCLSTTHIAFMDALNETGSIFAVSGIDYVYNQLLRDKADSGLVKDIGYEASLDFELLLSLHPDLVTVYDINGTLSPIHAKLKKLGIPTVQINEYLESSPLGQAEWIKFFAEFFDKRKEADSVFSMVYDQYTALKKAADTCKVKPSVVVNLPWKGIWYIPGGKSNQAQLIDDAGGTYYWSETEEQHTMPLHIEDVYQKAVGADYWINPGDASKPEDITGVDTRLGKFKALQTGNLYNRNKRMSPGGGNDCMESGIVRPDLILKDLIAILHPELLKGHGFYYYYTRLNN